MLLLLLLLLLFLGELESLGLDISVLAQSEVGEFDVPGGIDEDVVRFQVPVDVVEFVN